MEFNSALIRSPIVIITGPTGVGKTTLLYEILKESKGRKYTTMTSRPIRTGEEQGREYHFVSTKEFERAIRNKELVEWEEFNGHYYGTPINGFTSEDVPFHIMVIDVRGADTFKHLFGDQCVVLYVAARNFEAIQKRLQTRENDKSMVEERTVLAREEWERRNDFDHTVVNAEGKIDSALEQAIYQIETFVEQFTKNIK